MCHQEHSEPLQTLFVSMGALKKVKALNLGGRGKSLIRSELHKKRRKMIGETAQCVERLLCSLRTCAWKPSTCVKSQAQACKYLEPWHSGEGKGRRIARACWLPAWPKVQMTSFRFTERSCLHEIRCGRHKFSSGFHIPHIQRMHAHIHKHTEELGCFFFLKKRK